MLGSDPIAVLLGAGGWAGTLEGPLGPGLFRGSQCQPCLAAKIDKNSSFGQIYTQEKLLNVWRRISISLSLKQDFQPQ